MNSHSSFFPAEAQPFLVPIEKPAGRNADDPRLEIRAGVAAIALFATVFVGWAAIAPLGAAASAPGVVKVSGERKAVQSLTGGVISSLPVAEGSHVRAGDVIVRFADDEALGTERSLTRRVVGLEAMIARLDAQRTGNATVVAPTAFRDIPAEDRDEAMHALAVEQQTLATIRAAAAAQRATLHKRIAQIGAQISGYDTKRQSLESQQALNDQELTGVEKLAAQGYATQTRVLALKRSAAGLSGDAGSAGAEAAGLKSAAGEAQMQILEVDANLAQDTAKQLRDTQAELDTVIPQWEAARAKLAQMSLRAPVSGQVVALAIHTVGGVAAPGQVLMEVVPDDRSLVVEAQVNVADANEISVGQEARVRVTSLHGRQIPVLKGRVTLVSADALSDPKTGRSFYTASVQVPASELNQLSQAANIRGVRPGTPVDVQVSLHKTTMLSYWLSPIQQLFSHSMREN
jgi:HlyD family secretion protein